MQRRCVRACTVHGQRKAAVTASPLAAAAVSGEVQPAGPPKLAHRQCHRGSLARPASVRRSCGDGQAAVLQRMHCVVLTWGGGSLGSHSASTWVRTSKQSKAKSMKEKRTVFFFSSVQHGATIIPTDDAAR